MNRTRWKLTIGALALGLGGLAAVADGPSKPGVSCVPPPPKVARPPADVPILPLPPSKPEIVPVASPAPVPPLPVPSLKLPELAAAPVLPSVPTTDPLTLPSTPPVVEPKPAAESKPLSLPPAVNFEVRLTPAPALPAPEMKPSPPPLPPPAFTSPPAVAPTPPKPAFVEPPQPKPTAAPTMPAAEKKLKVLLHMGDDRPKFEVRDGDEVYLKVASNKVDVTSPADAGPNMSTMRAAGKVAFVTPGGEGTCDALVVVPGTGQVVVTGQVNFTYNWGKVETTVSGEKMTFRLGSAPAGGPAVAAK